MNPKQELLTLLEQSKHKRDLDHLIVKLRDRLMAEYGWMSNEEFSKLPLLTIWTLMEEMNSKYGSSKRTSIGRNTNHR